MMADTGLTPVGPMRPSRKGGRQASDPTLASLGQKYGCSAAQMAVAWLLDQKGVIVIPKAARSESQKANLDALGTQLDDKDRACPCRKPNSAGK
jgi:2,5-diketo-D-gluconate reductase B